MSTDHTYPALPDPRTQSGIQFPDGACHIIDNAPAVWAKHPNMYRLIYATTTYSYTSPEEKENIEMALRNNIDSLLVALGEQCDRADEANAEIDRLRRWQQDAIAELLDIQGQFGADYIWQKHNDKPVRKLLTGYQSMSRKTLHCNFCGRDALYMVVAGRSLSYCGCGSNNLVLDGRHVGPPQERE